MSLLKALKLTPATPAATSAPSAVPPASSGAAPPQRPAKGEIGHVAPYGRQGDAGWQNGKRITENEHVIPRGKQEALTRDGANGTPDYTDAHYHRNTALRVERDTALNKTFEKRGGPTADNAGTERLKAKADRADPRNGINYREEVFTESVDNMKRAARDTASRVTEAQIHEAALAQDGELFDLQRMKGTGQRIGATKADVDQAVARLDFGDDASAALRRSIEATRQRAHVTLLRAREIGSLLETKIGAASGEQKQALIEKRSILKKTNAEAVGAIEQADADLAALGNPATAREGRVEIEARRGSKASMAAVTEVDAVGLDDKSAARDKTTTTTSLDKGKATVEKIRSARKFGAAGRTATATNDKTVTSQTLVARSNEAKTTKVSLLGKTTIEEKHSREVELADGRKAGVEASTTKEFGAGGASKTQTVTTKGFDGSSTSTTRKTGVERGDGKVTATTSRSVTRTDTAGTARTNDASASGGMLAGKDGMGAQGAVEGGRKATTEGGMQAGVVGGLHANVVCKIGDPTGDPKRYPVSLTVSFGGAIGGSGGAGKKEGSKASASMEVKVSLEKSMTVTHMLGEAELGGYVKALEAASKGSKVAATYSEFAVIASGVKEDWGVAQKMWQAISKKSAASLKHAGDSIEVAEKKSVGVAIEGSAGPVGGGYSVTETDAASKKMVRSDKAKLDIDAKGSHTTERALSGSLSIGAAGASVGTTHTHQTRFGFAIEIDPKDDADGKMLADLGRCEKMAEYTAFLAAHPKARMVSKTVGKSDADKTDIGFSLGGKKVLELGTHQGVDEDTKTDATGKVLAKRVAGHAGAGGKLGGLADSIDEDAVAEVGADGDATLSMTRTVNDNHGSRARGKKARHLAAKLHLPGSGEQKATGALATAAGGDDDDTATHDVSGIKLNNRDLRRLGGTACRSMLSWMGRARRGDEMDDWEKAGVAIAKSGGKPSVVAIELARFVGGDSVERMKTLELFIRGGYHQTTGHAFEFPDSLHDVQEEYDVVTDDKLDEKMNTYANKSGDPAAAEECKRLVVVIDRIQTRIKACSDFRNIDTKTEMLQQLVQNRAMLVRGIKGYGGDLHPEVDAKILEDEGSHLMQQCTTYFIEQSRLAGKMDEADAWTVSDRAEGSAVLKQLEDLQYRWAGDYMRLQENFAQRKLQLVTMRTMQPDESIVATFEKKFRH